MSILVTGQADDILEFICGSRQQNDHCKAHKWHQYMINVNKDYLADIARRQAHKRAAGIGSEGRCPR